MKAPRRVAVLCTALTLAVLTSGVAWAAPEKPCSIVVKVSPSNQITKNEGQPVHVNGSNDGTGSATYLWVQTSGPSVSFKPTDSQLDFRAPLLETGQATLTFTLTATGCNPVQADSIVVTVTVLNVVSNQAPTAAITTTSPVSEGVVVTLDGSGSSDPNGDTLSYTWEQIAGPTVMIGGANLPLASFMAPEVGPSGASLTFRLTVSDGAVSDSSEAIVNVINLNQAPTVSASCPGNADETTMATLVANASDPDGDPLSYSWSHTDGAPAITPQDGWSSASVSFIAPYLAQGQDGLLKFQVVASDGSLQSNATCEVQILDVTKPELHLPGNITAEATSSAGAAVAFEATAKDLHDGSLDPACDPVSGSTFALGTTLVHCEALDRAGNKTEGSFDVTVQDTTEPELSLPLDQTVEATGPSGAVVTFSATATDLVDGEVAVTCTPASGSTFTLGNTNVSCEATDAHSNTASGSFQVKVQDTTPPALTLPSNISVEATGPSGATATYSASATDLVDGSVAISCTPASGATFALGATTVNCEATDQAGNKGTGSFVLDVVDTTPPAVTVPANMTVEATGPSGATASFAATASDIVDGSVPVTCTPPSGATFALGATTVNCDATDQAGNKGTAAFSVTVRDTTPPVLNIPANMTVEATGPAGAPASFSVTANDLVSGLLTATCTPSSGSTFPLGGTTVNCSAVDGAGNTATGAFSVTVEDTTPPLITAVSNGPFVLASAGPYYTATAVDLVSGAVPVECTPGPNTQFAVGSTTVNCTAKDAKGNTGHGSVTVTVVFAPASLCLAGPGHQVLQPIAPTGKSVFRQTGSTVPVKFRVCDANGSSYHATNPVLSFKLVGFAGVIFSPEETTDVMSTSADTAFRWSEADQFWIFNLSTKGYAGGSTYVFEITLVDGSTIPVQFGLK